MKDYKMTVETTVYADGTIKSSVDGFADIVLRTQEEQIKKALISLGWTPPAQGSDGLTDCHRISVGESQDSYGLYVLDD